MFYNQRNKLWCFEVREQYFITQSAQNEINNILKAKSINDEDEAIKYMRKLNMFFGFLVGANDELSPRTFFLDFDSDSEDGWFALIDCEYDVVKGDYDYSNANKVPCPKGDLLERLCIFKGYMENLIQMKLMKFFWNSCWDHVEFRTDPASWKTKHISNNAKAALSYLFRHDEMYMELYYEAKGYDDDEKARRKVRWNHTETELDELEKNFDDINASLKKIGLETVLYHSCDYDSLNITKPNFVFPDKRKAFDDEFSIFVKPIKVKFETPSDLSDYEQYQTHDAIPAYRLTLHTLLEDVGLGVINALDNDEEEENEDNS